MPNVRFVPKADFSRSAFLTFSDYDLHGETLISFYFHL